MDPTWSWDARFEVPGILQHAKHPNKTYGPHTISIPRIQPASGAKVSEEIPYPVSDAQFRKLVAVPRCSVPYISVILSTRESEDMRKFEILLRSYISPPTLVR